MRLQNTKILFRLKHRNTSNPSIKFQNSSTKSNKFTTKFKTFTQIHIKSINYGAHEVMMIPSPEKMLSLMKMPAEGVECVAEETTETVAGL
ncbi:hypothetical protein HanPSC8_Chr13g0576831 [Helianthus annuus]|nr:hypothetical protein HanPSC8_Chr13g0576831 [Helianthus annuus]